MDLTFAAPLIVLLALVCLIAVAGVRSPSLFRLALSFFLKKKRLTALTIVGLIVGSAIITGSLAVGDSLKSSVVDEVYANLGGVDEVVHSNGLFDESIFSAVSGNSTLAGVTDAIAPLVILKASVRNAATGQFEAKVNIVGYDASLHAFGEFRKSDGSSLTGVPASGRAVINQQLAGRIDALAGATLAVTTQNPGFSIESIFSPLLGQASFSVVVDAVVADTGLGRFNLESAGGVPENIYVSLGYLQNMITASSRINTIVVSNKGDVREGVKLTSEAVDRLQAVLDDVVGYRDMRLDVSALGYVKIESENVFFDGRYASAVQSVAGAEAASQLTSYFVNSISFQSRKVPYSTVTGLDPISDYQFGPFVDNSTGSPIVGAMSDNEIIMTNYTAGRLGARVGDMVTLNYTVYDATYSAIYEKTNFTVAYVVNMVGKAADPNLMPPFPGISGKASCADWDPPWISGSKMRSEMTWEDLYYWQTYGGTPKAYITLAEAQSLWSNDLGNLTTINVKGANPTQLAQQEGSRLNATIVAGDAGIDVSPAKQIGIQSAEGTQLLTETFLSFGMVVVISGIILEAALVAGVMEGRRREIALLKTLGTKRWQITQTFAFEGFLLSAISAAIGILVGLLVAFVCIWLTNTFWSNIVEGRTVSLYFTPETLVVGFVAGLLISFLAFVLFARLASASLITGALKENETSGRRRQWSRVRLWLALASLAAICIAAVLAPHFGVTNPTQSASLILIGPAIVFLSVPFIPHGEADRDSEMRKIGLLTVLYVLVITFVFASGANMDPFPLFFESGFVIVAAAVVGLAGSIRPFAAAFSRLAGGSGAGHATLRLALLSPSRRVRRTCLSVALFAVVVFTYLGLSVNIQGQQQNLKDATYYQGAGYSVLAESSVPVKFDLGSQQDRVKNGVVNFSDGTQVVQFLTVGQVGGSCSNLKRNLPPRLIAANETFVSVNVLRFQAPSGYHSIWAALNGVENDGAIPAVGDYNTIVWILGKGVGGHVMITDEHGVGRELVVVGIFENSIFQGSLFVSEDNLNNLYPTTADYRIFLFKTNDPPKLVTYLESQMQAYGMDASLVSDLVRDNASIEWSYMSLFQALLLVGLFVGIAGIAASSSKSVEDRRQEIGAMRAIGFKRSMVLGSFILENLYIASLGAVIGILTGLLVAFVFFGRGSLLSFSVAVPWAAIAFVVIAVDAAAVIATISPARKAARMHPVDALRREQ